MSDDGKGPAERSEAQSSSDETVTVNLSDPDNEGQYIEAEATRQELGEIIRTVDAR